MAATDSIDDAGHADVLSQLLEASWRGIAVPTLLVETDGGHNVVRHKRVDRNGVRVENTGLDGYVYAFRVPFVNTLARGPNESWVSLYPDTYRAFMSALEDRSTGVFQHPDYGQRKCKVATFKSVLDPDFRGGPTVNVQLMETVDDGDAVALADTAVIPIAAAAAADLDAFYYTLTPPPNTGTPRGMTLGQFVRALSSIGDEWNLFKAQVSASFDKVVNAVERIGAAYGAEPGVSDSTNRLVSSLHALRLTALLRDRPTGHHLVVRPVGLAALAQQLSTTVSVLLQLNPRLAGRAVVPAMTSVRYYT